MAPSLSPHLNAQKKSTKVCRCLSFRHYQQKKNMYHNDTTMTHAAPSEETKTSEEKQQRKSTEIEELETKQRKIEANLFRLRWRGEKKQKK